MSWLMCMRMKWSSHDELKGDAMSDLYELRCRECGKTWGNAPKSFCEDCFSPLEVSYDYDSLKKKVRRENLAGPNL